MFWAICMLAFARGWDCGLSPDNTPVLVALAGQTRGSELAPIRLRTEFKNFDLTPELLEEFNVIMASIQEAMTSTLKVYPIEGYLVLNDLSECGSEVEIPDSHKYPGLDNTDIVVYFTTQSVDDASYAAFGAPCAVEDGNRKAVIAGRIVINVPVYAAGTTSEKVETLSHQLMHVLGFTNSAILGFHSAFELLETTQVRGYAKSVFIGTTVKEKARKNFDCDTVQGLELEDDGNHWDMRVMFGEFMTPQTNPYPVYSELSFALLADSGWYSVDFQNIGQSFFGFHKGCDFLNNSCIKDGVAQFSEFCSDDSFKCDAVHISKAQCNLVSYPDALPSHFQYFDDPNQGGENSFVDYCPFQAPIEGGNCRDSQTVVYENWGEAVCDNCRCVGGTLVKSGEGDGTQYHAGCYEVLACDESLAILRIGIDSVYHAVSCPFTGGQMSVPGFEGYLDCPDSNILCDNFPCINGCLGQGKCVYGKCQCNLGRGGVDCSTVCGDNCYTCDAEFPEVCLGCQGENAVLNLNNECVCPDGYKEDGINCVSECADLCVGCASSDSNNCDACVDNAVQQSNGACVCDTGYIQSQGECKYDDFPLIDLSFTRIDDQYDLGDFRVRFHGDIKPAPRMGILGNADSYVEIYTDDVLNINEATQSVSMWIWLPSTTEGSIFSAYSSENKQTTIELKVTEKRDLMVNITDIVAQSTLSMSNLPLKEWVNVGYSIYYEPGLRSKLCLYMNTNTVCLPDAFDMYMDLSDYVTVRLGSFEGFVMSIKVYYGIVDPTIGEPAALCVNPPSCDVEPGNCEAGFVGNECSPCDCQGEPCARETDCRKNVDQECFTFQDMYSCEACYPGSILNSDGCTCRDNSEFDPYVNECECIDEAYEENGQCILLQTCGPLCETCEEENKTMCTECKDNSNFTVPNTHSPCQCDSGYTMNSNECVPTVEPTVHFIFDSGDVLYKSNGFTMYFAESTPFPVPTMGLYFKGSQYGELLTDTQVNTSTKSVEMWIRIDYEERGTIYAEQEMMENSSLSKIEFKKDTETSLVLKLRLNQGEKQLTATGLKHRHWMKIGFSISAASGFSDVDIFIDGLVKHATTYQDIYEAPNARYFIGGGPDIVGFHGFILSFSTSFGFIDTVLASIDDLCLSSVFCQIPPGDCEFLEYTDTSGQCSSCDCGDDHSCARGEDCRLHIDKECKSYENMYTCESCFEGASLVDGDCTCGVNAVLNESTGSCECMEGFSTYEGSCASCGNAFSSEEILAIMNEDYNQITIEFAYEVNEKRTACKDLLETASFQSLGIDPVCTWRTGRELQITIGLDFDVNMKSIELNPSSFTKAHPKECDHYTTELLIPIFFLADALTPIARIAAPDTFGINCGTELLLSAEQTLGLGGNVGEFFWSAVPDRPQLSEYLSAQVSSIVPIDSELLYEEVYSFNLTVVNRYLHSSYAIHNVNVFQEKVLSVIIDTGNNIEISAHESLLVRSKVESNCNSGFPTTYEWKLLSNHHIDIESILERTKDQPHLLLIEEGDLRPNESYVFIVEVKSGELSGSSELTIHVTESYLVAKIANISGTHSIDEDLVLDGTSSYDPDDDVTILNYEWTCTEGTSDCLDPDGDLLRIDSTKTTIIPKDKLKAGAIYDIILTVYDTNRFATDEVVITITTGNLIVKEHPPFPVTPNIPFLVNEPLENGITGNITWTQVSGAVMEPSTSTDYSFLKFPGDLLEAGNYYAWQIDYTDSAGNSIQSIHTWYTHTGADCLDELSILTGDQEELFIMNNCLTKEGNQPVWYYFGIMLEDRELPLYGPTKSNYVYMRLPSGTYSIFGSVCDETLACTRKTYKNYAVTESQEIILQSQEDFSSLFEFDTSDPELIPATVFYMVKEHEELSEETIEMLLDALNGYMDTLIDYNRVKVSTCIYVLKEFLQYQITKAKHIVVALDAIYVMLERSGINLQFHDIEDMYDTLNQLLPQFAEDVDVMQATQRTTQKMLMSYMEASPPFEDPTLFSIGTMYSKKERSTASSFLERSIELFGTIIDLPSKLPFEDTDVIDVAVTVLEKNSTNVIELTFSKSGTYIDGSFSQEPETILPLTSLHSPIRIEIPLRSKIDNIECVYLKDDGWETSGCKIVEVLDYACMVEITHTSMFTLRESEGNACNFSALFLGSGITLLMCVHVAVAIVLKRITLQKPPAQKYEIGNAEAEKKAFEGGTDEDKVFEMGDMKRGEEIKPSSPKKFLFVDMCRNHLLIGQVLPNFLPRDLRALLLYVGVFVCFLFAGIVITFENSIDDSGGHFIFGFTIGLVSVFFTGVIEFVFLCVENYIARVSIVAVVLAGALAGSIYIAAFTCSSLVTEWIIIFFIAAFADLFVYQTVLSAIKTIIYKSY